MPRTIIIDNTGLKANGIKITWIKTRQRLDISGWYSYIVEIDGKSYKLRDFFDALGITEKDCKKAWKEEKK